MKRKAVAFASVLGYALTTAPPSEAAFVTFSNEASFISAVSNAQMESFENVSLRDHLPDPVILDGIIVTSPDLLGIRDDFDSGAHPTHGVQYLSPGSPTGETLIFNFENPITAFGINIIDYGDAAPGSLTLNTDAGHSLTIATAPPFLQDGNDFFFGLIEVDMFFTTVTMVETNVGDGFVLDELYFSPVPIPTSFFLFGSAVAAFALATRRKRANINNNVTL